MSKNYSCDSLKLCTSSFFFLPPETPRSENDVVGTYPQPVLHDGHGLVHDERQPEHAHVVLEVVADTQVLQHRHAQPLQVLARPDAGQHQQLRAADAAGREDHLAFGVDRVQAAVAQELHPRRLVGGGVDDHLRDVRVHGDVQVGPEPSRPQERLGRAAPGAPSDRALEQIETRVSPVSLRRSDAHCNIV